jgi:hypothetical protein
MTVSLEGLSKPTVKLTGSDGNAFAVIGKVRRALKDAGWTVEQIKAFSEEAMAGDYDHVLQTCMKYADVE